MHAFIWTPFNRAWDLTRENPPQGRRVAEPTHAPAPAYEHTGFEVGAL